MRNRITLGLLFLCWLMAAPLPASANGVPGLLVNAKPQTLPLIVFHDQQARPWQLADFRGQLLVVNIWASWCATCVMEMPSLSRLQKKMGAEGLQVITISQDADGATVPGFFDRLWITNLPPFADVANIAVKRWDIPGLPATYIINPQGQEVARIFGATQWDSPAMIATLRQWLPNKPPPTAQF